MPFEKNLARTLACAAGSSARRIGTLVRPTNAIRVTAVTGGAAMGLMWGSVRAIVNIRKVRRGEITTQDAVCDTACESLGIGVATGVGIAAAGASSIVVGTALVPFLVGAAVSGGTKVLWDKAIGPLAG